MASIFVHDVVALIKYSLSRPFIVSWRRHSKVVFLNDFCELTSISIDDAQYLSFSVQYNDSSEARIISHSLESHGISTHVESQDASPVTGLMTAALPQYNIFVHAGDMVEARKLLEIATRGSKETWFKNYIEDGRGKGMRGGVSSS